MPQLRKISAFSERISPSTGEKFYLGTIGGVKVALMPTEKLDDSGNLQWVLVSDEAVSTHNGAQTEILTGGCVVYRHESMFPALRKSRRGRRVKKDAMA